MKLAWLCYNIIPNSGGEFGPPLIKFYEPDNQEYDTVIPIVYAEIIEE